MAQLSKRRPAGTAIFESNPKRSECCSLVEVGDSVFTVVQRPARHRAQKTSISGPTG
jgi:hypothetical protein